MESWEGKSKATPLGYRIFIQLIKIGGRKSAYLLLFFVAQYYIWFVPAATKPLKYLYRKRMGFSAAQTRKLIRKNILTFGQTLIDKVAILADVHHGLEFEHAGGIHLNDMLKDEKGGFVISAHLGNWEAAGHMLQRLETAINIVMYDGETENIKQALSEEDEKRSFNVINITDDGQHIFEISAALARNELICLHADRFRPGNRTLSIEFLGEKAEFPMGPFILGAKMNAPVCFVFAFKKDKDNYRYQAYPAKYYRGRGQQAVEEMAKDFVELLEKEIKNYPEQWFNYYPFWNENDHTN